MNTQTPETRRRIAQFKRVLAAATAINDLMGDPVHEDVYADLEATLETLKRCYDICPCEECGTFVEVGESFCSICSKCLDAIIHDGARFESPSTDNYWEEI